MMIRFALVSIMFAMSASCASAHDESSKPPTLVGNWLYVGNPGESGLGLTFRADGTYGLAAVVLVSSTAAQAEVESGTYTSDATHLTLTPKMSTCPRPHPVEVDTYQFSGDLLVISSPAGSVSLKSNPATIDQSFAIQAGCPDKDGHFTPSPLAPVSN